MSENKPLGVIVDEILAKVLGSKEAVNDGLDVELPFDTIEEYEEFTGKKFRRKKDQVKRNLPREESFEEFKLELLEQFKAEEVKKISKKLGLIF